MDDFLSKHVPTVLNLIETSATGHLAPEEICKILRDVSEHRLLPAKKKYKQCLVAFLGRLRKDERICVDKKGFYLAIDEIEDPPHWICMHPKCKRRFDIVSDFQIHLNESNHFNGSMTKEVSKLCHKKLTKLYGAKITASICPSDRELQIVGLTCVPNHEQQTAASVSVCPADHVLQTDALVSVSVCPADHALQTAASVPASVCPADHVVHTAASVSTCPADHVLQTAAGKKGIYPAMTQTTHIPHWICKVQFCGLKYKTVIGFQKHLSESKHYDGKITKKVSNQCYMKLPIKGVASTAIPNSSRYYEKQSAASVSVCSAEHGLQQSNTNNNLAVSSQGVHPSLRELNDLLSDDLIVSSGLHDEIDSEKGDISVVSVEAGPGNDNVDEVGDDPCPIDSICKERIIQYFCSTPSVEVSRKGNVLADYSNAQNFHECALVGQLIGVSKLDNEDQVEEQHQEIYLNTHEPFCLVTVGVQGSGKSHTLATVLEGCLIQFPVKSVCRLEKPMTTLVLHYDESVTSRCEVRYRTIIILLPSTSNY